MSRLTASDLATNPTLARCLSPADRKHFGSSTPAEVAEKRDGRLERDLRRECENWLTLHGYHRLTTGQAAAEALGQATGRFDAKGGIKTQAGGTTGLESPCRRLPNWFVSLPTNRKASVFLPDLLLIRWDWRHCLAVELKRPGTGTPHYEPGQQEMIQACAWTLVRSLDELIDEVKAWERKGDAASLAI